MNNNNLPRAQWSSYSSYVLVTTGAIVGLGNIFHFPFLVVQYGGLFILFYVLCAALLTVPVLFAELLIGRRGKQNPVGAISIVAMESRASRYWRWIGWLCFLILFLTLSYYTVSVAFPLSYLIDNIGILAHHGTSPNFETIDYTNISAHFAAFEICFLIFLVATMAVIVRGINRGLEGISAITVPIYFILLFILAIYACIQGNFIGALAYLFHVPETQTMLPIFFAALTFAFFKLNVGMGSMMVYGSYLPYEVPLAQSTIVIVLLDAIASLLSYFIICPLMLQSHLNAHEATLAYHDVMLIFTAAPHGVIVAFFFFLAAVVAAWTPTIAMAESSALTLIERLQITRLKGAAIIFILAFILGTLCVLSYTHWSHILIFSRWTIDQFVQIVAADIATPISAFLIAIFSGWVVARSITESELEFYPFFYRIWRFLIRYLAPISILLILILVGFW